MSDRRKQEFDDIRKIMKTYYGRRMLYRLLEVTGVFNSTWTPCHATISYLTGKREVGVVFESDIRTVDADGYTLMIKEAQTRREKEQVNGTEEDFEVV